jgi:hypothetical protein
MPSTRDYSRRLNLKNILKNFANKMPNIIKAIVLTIVYITLDYRILYWPGDERKASIF